jgi:hypothetical protein
MIDLNYAKKHYGELDNAQLRALLTPNTLIPEAAQLVRAELGARGECFLIVDRSVSTTFEFGKNCAFQAMVMGSPAGLTLPKLQLATFKPQGCVKPTG